ncbi:MAG: hypothetical protein AAFR39_06120 [Pseudomonadota bacterium]
MSSQNRKIFLETTANITKPAFHARLKIVVNNTGISEREWPDQIQNLIRDLDGKAVSLWTQPEHVPYPLIDDAWGGNERWVREFLKSGPRDHPDRVRWLALYVSLNWPEVYRHLLR